ncbi:GNAT family N-acetyltransferase [Streptomyces sp. NPDC050738]|uniref:GNAT family N-acetyltransferase n=1 Tax=Streptomyces sp. NPDC050738 TaxID=3154744 RepID=UPI003441EDBC
MKWELRAAEAADIETIAELRALVMRPDLVRLGRYDEVRVRQRFRDGFLAEYTWVVEIEGEFAGSVTLRPEGEGLYLENFYLEPRLQGQGVGAGILATLLQRADDDALPVRLQVLQGSAARRLYERHGFVPETEDAIDVFMVRPLSR